MKYCYHIFISYAYDYTFGYNKLKDILNENNKFEYIDCSFPKPDDKNNNEKKIKAEITKRIYTSNIVIALEVDDYIYRPWIKYEIITANKFNKPILGIQKDYSELFSKYITEVSTWDSEDIITTIHRLLSTKTK